MTGDVPPSLSAVIVNYEAGAWLLRCLGSLHAQPLPVEVIVVDNGSSDGSTEAAVARYPETRVLRPGANLGFAGGANAGARAAGSELLLFLNPDVELLPGCLEALVDAFDDPRVAVAGPSVRVLASETVERGGTIDPFGYPVALHETAPPLYVPGCALMMRAAVFEELGGFDARYFLFVEDVDLCWRALIAGWDVRIAAGAEVLHAGGSVAPGGYVSRGTLKTSRLRVGLRERNTLATLLKCYGPVSLALVAVPYLAQALVTVVGLALAGRWRTSLDLLRGIAWNVRETSRTAALRRRVRSLRRVPDKVVRERMYRGFQKGRLALQVGWPSVDDA